jgi:rod shape-determining protein MreD
MNMFFSYLPFAIILQLIFSELLTINGYQANIILIFIILFSMPFTDPIKSTWLGFFTGLFCDFVFFTGTYIGVSSFVFSLVGYWSSKVSNNFAFRNFDIYWIAFVNIAVLIYSLFRYDYLFFNDFFIFFKNWFFITLYTCFVGLLLIKIFSLKDKILNA